jgi:hypothetical protein
MIKTYSNHDRSGGVNRIGGTFLVMLFVALSIALGEERFESGKLKGFTRISPDEVATRLERPLVVYKPSGTVLRNGGDGSGIEGVLFELRGPGNSTVIRAAKTDSEGRFRLDQVPSGRYMFKLTAAGFQSLVGVVFVSPNASPDRSIHVRMAPDI